VARHEAFAALDRHRNWAKQSGKVSCLDEPQLHPHARIVAALSWDLLDRYWVRGQGSGQENWQDGKKGHGPFPPLSVAGFAGARDGLRGGDAVIGQYFLALLRALNVPARLGASPLMHAGAVQYRCPLLLLPGRGSQPVLAQPSPTPIWAWQTRPPAAPVRWLLCPTAGVGLMDTTMLLPWDGRRYAEHPLDLWQDLHSMFAKWQLAADGKGEQAKQYDGQWARRLVLGFCRTALSRYPAHQGTIRARAKPWAAAHVALMKQAKWGTPAGGGKSAGSASEAQALAAQQLHLSRHRFFGLWLHDNRLPPASATGLFPMNWAARYTAKAAPGGTWEVEDGRWLECDPEVAAAIDQFAGSVLS
jgi:hypothetical protein